MPHRRNPLDRSLIATDRRAWSKLRARIIARDQGRCQLCGANGASEVDHIIERRLGGGDEPQNLRLLCTNCHARRRRLPRMAESSPLLYARAAGQPGRTQPAQFPVHSCEKRGSLPTIRGNTSIGWWKGEGCPPECDLPPAA
jgi:hypothetical protein